MNWSAFLRTRRELFSGLVLANIGHAPLVTTDGQLKVPFGENNHELQKTVEETFENRVLFSRPKREPIRVE